MVRLESQYLHKGRVILTESHTCTIPPVLDGLLVKSESTWSYCQIDLWFPSSTNQYPDAESTLKNFNHENFQGHNDLLMFGYRMKFYSSRTVSIRLRSTELLHLRYSTKQLYFYGTCNAILAYFAMLLA